MLSDLIAIYDLIEKLAEKKKSSDEEKVFNKVIAVMYKLGNMGTTAVSLEQIVNEGISKMNIFRSIERADLEGLILPCMSFGPEYRWMLSPKGTLYFEALLSEEN